MNARRTGRAGLVKRLTVLLHSPATGSSHSRGDASRSDAPAVDVNFLDLAVRLNSTFDDFTQLLVSYDRVMRARWCTMRIKQVRIHNYRSVGHLDLQCQPLMVLMVLLDASKTWFGQRTA